MLCVGRERVTSRHQRDVAGGRRSSRASVRGTPDAYIAHVLECSTRTVQRHRLEPRGWRVPARRDNAGGAACRVVPNAHEAGRTGIRDGRRRAPPHRRVKRGATPVASVPGGVPHRPPRPPLPGFGGEHVRRDYHRARLSSKNRPQGAAKAARCGRRRSGVVGSGWPHSGPPGGPSATSRWSEGGRGGCGGPRSRRSSVGGVDSGGPTC